ncbi:PhzF family phenazine biosynthesis protein [Utexia brackfieldae]|uniref:PhzF family phenazine biosynthesis protein n=1 Tax=Utexia brackfieldae TaxID=3074108 RepID=UPI00370D6615
MLLTPSRIEIPFYVVDAFTQEPFKGNPAAVVLLESWPTETLLQSIASEFNLSETAFLVGQYLRWFTPKREVDLCGHATLATAHILRQHQQHLPQILYFKTRLGILKTAFQQQDIILNFPVIKAELDNTVATRRLIEMALDLPVKQIYTTLDRYVCYLDYEKTVRQFEPDFEKIRQLPLPGLIITAAGQGSADFVSRYFAPAKGILEDPVTGSSHCVLAPLWGKQLNKSILLAEQLSERGGRLICQLHSESVSLIEQARTSSAGTLFL